MQDAVEAQLIQTVNIIAERTGAIGGRVEEVARDMAEVKDHLGTLNGSVAKHEKALTEVMAWQKAHNADHAGAREDRNASANRRVEWAKAIVPSALSAIVLILWLLGIAPTGAARALDVRLPESSLAPVGATTPTAAATTTEDLRGGGGEPAGFVTPTPIAPRVTLTPNMIIEATHEPQGDPLALIASVTILIPVSLRDCPGNLDTSLPTYPRAACPAITILRPGETYDVTHFYSDRDANRWGFILISNNVRLIAVCYGGISYVSLHPGYKAEGVAPRSVSVKGCEVGP